MAEQVGGAEAAAWLVELARVCAEKKDELTDLDAAIGDADHGLNLDRGLSAVKEQLPEQPADPADVLQANGHDPYQNRRRRLRPALRDLFPAGRAGRGRQGGPLSGRCGRGVFGPDWSG